MAEAQDNNELPSVAEYSAPIDEQKRPDPLPEGEFKAEVSAARRALSKSSGRPNYELTFMVKKDNYPHDFVGPEGGVKLMYWTSSEDTDDARYKLKLLCEAAGLPAPKKRFDALDFLGKEVILRVVHEEFPKGSGTKQARIKEVKKIV